MSNVSDHFATFSVVSCNSSNTSSNTCKTVKYRIDCEANRNSLSNEILSQDWKFIERYNCADSAYDAFSDKIISLYNKNFPIKTKKIKQIDLSKPYVTNEIKLLIKRKHQLQKLYNRWPITYSKDFKAMRNKLNSTLRKAKANYFKNKLLNEKHSPRNTWRILNSLLGREKGASEYSVLVDGEIVSDPYEVATGFNEFFSKIGANLAQKFSDSNDFQEYLPPMNSNIVNFQMNPTTVEEVTNTVFSLRNASPGHDDLPLFVFRENILNLVDALTYICNLSLTTGIFPAKLAIAKVVCIYKSGDPSDTGNYRPISVLPILSKLLEKLVTVRLTAYFSENRLLTDCQYGFRKDVSTLDAMHAVVDSLQTSFNTNKIIIGVFIDLAKAFDSLDRRKLLLKLSHYGVSGIALDWFESYFGRRQQFVQYKNVSSSHLPVHFGVAQGSLIGPLLFIIYMNDMVCCSRELNFILYADDTNVFLESEDLGEGILKVNHELRRLDSWMKANSLTLNVTKLHHVVFHNRKKKLPICKAQLFIDKHLIKRVPSTKFLGIQLDENLLFNVHVGFVIRKLSKFIPIMYNVRNNLLSTSLKNIYNCLIYPNLTCCVSIWGTSQKANLKPLFVLQKKLIRIICFKNRMHHSAPLFKSLYILPLNMITRYMTCTYVFKILQKGSAPYFEIFNCCRSSRSSDAPTLSLPPIMTTQGRRSIRWMGPKAWNALPQQIRRESSYDKFKQLTKSYLLQL